MSKISLLLLVCSLSLIAVVVLGDVTVVDHTYRIPNAQQQYNSKEARSKRTELMDAYLEKKKVSASPQQEQSSSSSSSSDNTSEQLGVRTTDASKTSEPQSIFDGQLPTSPEEVPTSTASPFAKQRSAISERVLRGKFEMEAVQAERNFIEAQRGEITQVSCPLLGECALSFSPVLMD